MIRLKENRLYAAKYLGRQISKTNLKRVPISCIMIKHKLGFSSSCWYFFLVTMKYEMRLEQLCKYHANIFWIKMLPNPKQFYSEKGISISIQKNFQRQELNTKGNGGRNMQINVRTVPVLCFLYAWNLLLLITKNTEHLKNNVS